MSMFFRHWLDEGFYEEDGSGDMTRLEDPDSILEAQRAGKLREHDGTGFSEIGKHDNIDIDETLRRTKKD